MFLFLQDEVILVGHSMGGTFLAKYLSENLFPKKIAKLVLTAPAHNQTREVGDFVLGELGKVLEQVEEIHLCHSEDDPVVPFSEMSVFESQLPRAQTHTFSDRKHFNDPHFPELVEILKK